ncbi:MAG: hypothetical protein ND895_17925 [Pyrinomonadaceae bacterium]|nr:hypothetical protein [Pyrinomonadaceae bacterium]
MSDGRWRQAAYEFLPMFRDRVDNAEDVGMLWNELWDCEVEGIRDEPLTEEAISSLFGYASWCLLSDDEKCQNAAIISFYEMLPTNARVRTNLHSHLSVKDFLGLKELFEYHLSKEEHVKFIEEFLGKASQGKEAPASD